MSPNMKPHVLVIMAFVVANFCLPASDWGPAGACSAIAQAPARADMWTFQPRVDPFSTECLLDLRALSEKTAGQSGWMAARDGKLYVPGRKEPFRGWSAGVSNAISYAKEPPGPFRGPGSCLSPWDIRSGP